MHGSRAELHFDRAILAVPVRITNDDVDSPVTGLPRTTDVVGGSQRRSVLLQPVLNPPYIVDGVHDRSAAADILHGAEAHGGFPNQPVEDGADAFEPFRHL